MAQSAILDMERAANENLTIFLVHLALSFRIRHHQLSDLYSLVKETKAPHIVAGDFNDVWGTLGRKLLEPAGFEGQARPIRTFPAYAPVRALDAVYVRGGVRIRSIHRSHLRLASQASDHLPLFAEIEFL